MSRALTACRAATWLGALATGWSQNLVWGPDSAVGKGAPISWENRVIGALILCLASALLLSIAGRRWKACAVALALSVGAVAMAMALLQRARASNFTHLLEGDGWKWMVGGAGISVLAALGALVLALLSAPRVAAGGAQRKRKATRRR